VGQISPDVLTRLIAKLPPGYRAVLNLHIFEGRSHKEIAALLGIKPDSSASQFLRAKRMLAKMINESINHND
jgi:RNA polymerase sigma-70 factor (ECF subfamily)